MFAINTIDVAIAVAVIDINVDDDVVHPVVDVVTTTSPVLLVVVVAVLVVVENKARAPDQSSNRWIYPYPLGFYGYFQCFCLVPHQSGDTPSQKQTIPGMQQHRGVSDFQWSLEQHLGTPQGCDRQTGDRSGFDSHYCVFVFVFVIVVIIGFVFVSIRQQDFQTTLWRGSRIVVVAIVAIAIAVVSVTRIIGSAVLCFESLFGIQ